MSAPPTSVAAPLLVFDRVASPRGPLRGITFTATEPVVFVVDAPTRALGGPSDSPARAVLDLIAGVRAPSAGAVRVFGADPMMSTRRRRRIAHLGTTGWFANVVDLRSLFSLTVAIATVRGVDALATPAAIARWTDAWRASHDSVATTPAYDLDPTMLRDLADTLADGARADLLLVASPEQYVGAARARLVEAVRAARKRGASVVIATAAVDPWLWLADDSSAPAFVLEASGNGVTVNPAHALPWSRLAGTPRLLDVALVVADRAATSAEPAASLAAALLLDAPMSAAIVSIERRGSTELLITTTDARELVRVISARAAEGLEVRSVRVTAHPLAGATKTGDTR